MLLFGALYPPVKSNVVENVHADECHEIKPLFALLLLFKLFRSQTDHSETTISYILFIESYYCAHSSVVRFSLLENIRIIFYGVANLVIASSPLNKSLIIS